MPFPERLTAGDLVGRLVVGSAASWHVDDGSGERTLVHAWLLLEDGPAMFHTLSGVVIYRDPVYKPYLMEELGARVVIEASAGPEWEQLVGHRITSVRRLVDRRVDADAGWLVEANGRRLAVVDLGDELVAGKWPDEGRWAPVGIELSGGTQ